MGVRNSFRRKHNGLAWEGMGGWNDRNVEWLGVSVEVEM